MLSKLINGVRRRIGQLKPAHRRAMRDIVQRDAAFDAAHGVDTARNALKHLTIHSPNKQHGFEHIASAPREFARAMAALDIRFDEYTFIDLGSGKGRALMLSLEYPFRRRIGVEFAQELHDIARQNLAGRPVELHRQDATQFDFPDTPLVVFLYNPFGPEIMAQVAERLRTHPAPCYVVYVNPFYAEPWFEQGFEVTARGDPFLVLVPALSAALVRTPSRPLTEPGQHAP